MAAGKLNLLVEQGATFRRVLALQDAAGAAIDLTGFTARMQARAKVADPNPPLLDLTSSPAAGLAVDGAAGTVTVVLTDEQTAALTWTAAVYDLEVESAGGEVTRVVQGTIKVSPEVTR